MKKILELLVYKPNRWFDNQEEPKKVLVFLLFIVLPLCLTVWIISISNNWLPYIIHLVAVIGWRVLFLARPMKTYVFDIETQGLHNTSFDYAFMIEQEKKKSTAKPEIIDIMKINSEISKKSEK